MINKTQATVVVLFVGIVSIIGIMPEKAEAQDSKPVQLSLIHPVQLFPAETNIQGIRLNLIYGRNESVSGLDIGLINHATTFKGLQYGAVGISDSDFVGWQYHFVNIAKESVTGAQTGLFNSAGDMKGFQYGFVNTSDQMNGVQLGVVNYTQRMTRGLQIGVVNIISEGGKFPVFPVVNWSF